MSMVLDTSDTLVVDITPWSNEQEAHQNYWNNTFLTQEDRGVFLFCIRFVKLDKLDEFN